MAARSAARPRQCRSMRESSAGKFRARHPAARAAGSACGSAGCGIDREGALSCNIASSWRGVQENYTCTRCGQVAAQIKKKPRRAPGLPTHKRTGEGRACARWNLCRRLLPANRGAMIVLPRCGSISCNRDFFVASGRQRVAASPQERSRTAGSSARDVAQAQRTARRRHGAIIVHGRRSGARYPIKEALL